MLLMRLMPFVSVERHERLVAPFVAFLHVSRGISHGLKIKHFTSAIRARTCSQDISGRSLNATIVTIRARLT